MPPKKRQRCFVIMPFSETTKEHTGDYWTKHFDSYLKPLIEECPELEAQRSEPLRGDILRQIITDLVTCPVVVADLTDHNPNVYWELGVRQSFKHGTVTIAQYGTKLPFDVGAQGTLFYHPKDHVKDAHFRRRFKAAIQDCLSQPDIPDSHVLETISGRGTLFEIFRRDEAMRRLDAVLSECNGNLDLLKRVIKRAQDNQKNPDAVVYVTDFCRTPAVELLITNRYVDEEQAFYRSAEIYLSTILALNGRIGDWPQRRDSIEKWFLGQQEGVEDILNKFNGKVTAAREELAKTI